VDEDKIIHLCESLYSDDVNTRRWAVTQLDELGVKDAFGDLIELYKRESDELIKIAIIRALRHSREERVVEFLTSIFDDASIPAKWMIERTLRDIFPNKKTCPISLRRYKIKKMTGNEVAMAFARLAQNGLSGKK